MAPLIVGHKNNTVAAQFSISIDITPPLSNTEYINAYRVHTYQFTVSLLPKYAYGRRDLRAGLVDVHAEVPPGASASDHEENTAARLPDVHAKATVAGAVVLCVVGR